MNQSTTIIPSFNSRPYIRIMPYSPTACDAPSAREEPTANGNENAGAQPSLRPVSPLLSSSPRMLAAMPIRNNSIELSGFSESPCMESFKLFRQCSNNSSDTKTFSCSAAVANYMKCALNKC
mmetsp:Transcript_13091/g.22443  ORF Transcript_13091/g.22443 Transcript_13091/m.22443 type:complete len:122 (+) Transcript_13091:94-459(+)